MTRRARATPRLTALTGWLALLLLLSTVLAGCAGTRVESSHPLVRDAGEDAARVYFIRPFTERYLGYADNAISIESGDRRLLRMVKGEYTLATLAPGPMRLTVRSDTNFGPEDFRYKEMTRWKDFEFRAGQTYFIVLKPFDGEFRGVHFEMESVDLPRARELSRHLRVAGPARSAPIRRL